MYDKGYRCTEDAFKEGEQLTMSGNERGVRYSKQSGIIKRGINPRSSFVRIDNVWLSWAFQCNFMYHSVL